MWRKTGTIIYSNSCVGSNMESPISPQIVFLDFESPYETQKPRGIDRPRYSLSNMTYEEYIFSPLFKVFCAAIKVGADPTEFLWGEELKQRLHELFPPENNNIMVAHNAMFDGAILGWHYGLHPRKIYCTQAMSNGLWPQLPASLARLAERLFPKDATKRKTNELVNYANLLELPEEALLPSAPMRVYTINDIDLLFDCFGAMVHRFPAEELELISIAITAFTDPVLVLDKELIEKHINDLSLLQEKTITEANIHEDFETALKILSSNAKFVAYLKNVHDIDVPVKHSPTPTNPDNETWALAKKDYPFVKLRHEHPELDTVWKARFCAKSTIESTRARRMLAHTQKDGTLAMPLKYAAAHTLRFGGTNKLNPQNLKRGSPLRKALRAPGGHKLIIGDLSNIEVRVLAWLANERQLLDIFKANGDPYNSFGAQIYGRPIDRKGADAKQGHVAKTAVLGLGYGMGANKFQTTLATDVWNPIWLEDDEAERIVMTYRATFPAIPALWREAEKMIRVMYTATDPVEWRGLKFYKNSVVHPSGTRLIYPRLKCTNLTEATSMDRRPEFSYWNGKFMKSLYGGLFVENIVQWLARIVMTQAMVDIEHHGKYTYGSTSRIVLTVHDEVIQSVPARHAEAATAYMNRRLSQTPEWGDDRMSLKAEVDYDDCYSK